MISKSERQINFHFTRTFSICFDSTMFKVIIIQVGSIRKCAPALPSNFVNKQSVCASKVDFKKLYLLSDLYVYIEQAVHCFLKSALSLGDNLAGSWDISRNLPISWRRNWDKLIFSVHFQTHDRLEHTDYLGPSQQGENCFLNQPVFYKHWQCFDFNRYWARALSNF